jgi:hypothetical protein
MSESAAMVAIFAKLSKLLKDLDEEDYRRIATSETQIFLAPKGTQIIRPLDFAALASEVRQIGSQDEIVRLLDGDSRLTAANLKKLAEELNIDDVPKTRSKGPIQLHIAQSAASHWQRTRGRL